MQIDSLLLLRWRYAFFTFWTTHLAVAISKFGRIRLRERSLLCNVRVFYREHGYQSTNSYDRQRDHGVLHSGHRSGYHFRLFQC
jgi:hypothetical protein